ncbi:MAG: Tetratricopeptide 2 repeat protein [Myxococcales bacterium]|nr:Tetratricopeptide 2 repeat protein [Myxococcales bacterium]
MADPDRRPTAQEIEELIDLVRRDPSSPAFIDLGEAYLALGRPKDAISVGNMGLQASPENLEGRVMIARAYAQLHQWKEAQGELLRVVKVDRSSRLGFALLGETLLRRNDFERAVPVLQHAQNLDPTSPQILSMLKRARSGQALDPPPPLPTPVPPRGETNYNLSIEPASSRSRDPATPVAPPPQPQRPRMPPPLQQMQQPVPQSSPVAPTMAIKPQQLDPNYFTAPEPPPSRAPKQTAPPPMSVEGVRPRVISTARPQNAASAALRQSAAVGENYLNDLLTGGLLDVAGVRVPDGEFDLRPERRWGRSTRRAFAFLFVVLVLGIGGGGTWYWWTEKQKHEAVARLQNEAKTAIGAGDFAGLESSFKLLVDALEKDNANLLTFAYYVQTTGLEALLYGTDAARVDTAIKAIAHDIKPGDPGSRELMVGKAALELSRLGSLEAPATTLGEVVKMLDEYLAKNDGDKWVRWLKARALLAAGERKAAKAALKVASDGADGLAIAMIDSADLLVDEGALDEAFALYDKALEKSKGHPLAIVGKSLARAESSVQANAAIEDLHNNLVDKNFGPRVNSYRDLALALADAGIEDYHNSSIALKSATAQNPPLEPRFWARIAWARLISGDIKGCAAARDKIAWYGKTKPEDDPSVMLVDAGLSIASGLPDKALTVASKIEGVRARLLRSYSELDLGKAKDALADVEEALKKAPESLEAQILREEARMVAGPEKERVAAADALEHLARKAKSKIGRHALGLAYFMVNDIKNAQPQLEQAVADVAEESPNPVAYRSHTALATILLAANDTAGMGKHADAALAQNSGYLPALAVAAYVSLKNGDPDHALELLQPVVKESEAATAQVMLVVAEAVATHKKPFNGKACPCPSADDKADAQRVLESIKDKITPPTEVGRVAALIDPKLPETLGVPVPDGTPGVKPPPRHHHR